MEITIHRALSQLKTTQARIEDKLEKDLYISSTIGKTNMAEGRPVDAVKREILANFDSMEQFLKNFQTLKLAIIRSNSGITEESTNIKTGTVEDLTLTVAEAIAIQKYVLPLRERFVRRLEAQLNSAKRTVEMANTQANNEIASVLDALSNKDSKNPRPKPGQHDHRGVPAEQVSPARRPTGPCRKDPQGSRQSRCAVCRY